MGGFTKPRKAKSYKPPDLPPVQPWLGGMPELPGGAATRPPLYAAGSNAPNIPGNASVALLFLTINDPKNPGASPPCGCGRGAAWSWCDWRDVIAECFLLAHATLMGWGERARA